MGKYIFEDGGEDLYSSTDFFNSYVDQLLAAQNSMSDDSSQEKTATTDEESDFIKSLKAYDEEKEKPDYESLMNEKIDEAIATLTEKLAHTQNKLSENIWYDDEESVNYLSDMYNTNDANTPYDFGSVKYRQMMAESGGNPKAVSPVGAQGAFQFMPSTWEQYKPSPTASPFNKEEASQAYDKYMSTLLKTFKGDKRKAVAAYNAGEGRVKSLSDKYGSSWESHLPSETKNYLIKVFK